MGIKKGKKMLISLKLPPEAAKLHWKVIAYKKFNVTYLGWFTNFDPFWDSLWG